MVPVLIILGSILVLIIDFIVAKEFKSIASLKGYNDNKYFWYTFLFGPCGMLMIIALPQSGIAAEVDIRKTNLEDKSKSSTQSSFEKRMQASAVIPKLDEHGKAVCPICGTAQNKTNEMCYSCGTLFKK
ncbi:MAG: hypothetical protein IJK34_03885 [Clostridia bacterium]|nr:hypothetical protein [Clostridia bacterium]